jgi:hypothetical protein
MNALRKWVCISVSLPLPLSMTTGAQNVNREQYQLTDLMEALLLDAAELARGTAQARIDLLRSLEGRRNGH